MNLFPSHITLSGETHLVADLFETIQPKNEWEQEFFDFLYEWYNDSGFIEVYTSGSTGAPKKIQLKKEFVGASALRTIIYFGLEPNDAVLHCLPSKYIAGKLMIVRAIIGKLDLYLVDPSSDFSLLKVQSFKFGAMVPNQVSKLLELDSWNLKFLLIGGAAIPAVLEQKLQNISAYCFSSYGMTETATHVAVRKLNGAGASQLYHCLDGIYVELSVDGCLGIIMPGLEDILQTTDLAKLEDNKTFQILGRSDHVIISGGIKFSPEQIEKKLEPFIRQPFIVSSKPHSTLGEQIVLVVEAQETVALKEEIKKTIQQELEKFEQPRQIIFQKELAKTDNGKIKRYKLEC